MKKHTGILFLLLVLLAFNSCKSQKNNLDLFETKLLDSNFISLKKKPISLSVENTIINEVGYSINIPNDFKKYTTNISSIPNEVIFEYQNEQKILIIENKSSLKSEELLNLNKQDFINKLLVLKFSSLILDNEFSDFKNNSFFGIKIIKEYAILYINIKKARKDEFNKSLLSFKY